MNSSFKSYYLWDLTLILMNNYGKFLSYKSFKFSKCILQQTYFSIFAKFQVCLNKSLSTICTKCASYNYLCHFCKRKGSLTSASCTFDHHAMGSHRLYRCKVTIRRHQTIVGKHWLATQTHGFQPEPRTTPVPEYGEKDSMGLRFCFIIYKIVIMNTAQHIWLLKVQVK